MVMSAEGMMDRAGITRAHAILSLLAFTSVPFFTEIVSLLVELAVLAPVLVLVLCGSLSDSLRPLPLWRAEATNCNALDPWGYTMMTLETCLDVLPVSNCPCICTPAPCPWDGGSCKRVKNPGRSSIKDPFLFDCWLCVLNHG